MESNSDEPGNKHLGSRVKHRLKEIGEDQNENANLTLECIPEMKNTIWQHLVTELKTKKIEEAYKQLNPAEKKHICDLVSKSLRGIVENHLSERENKYKDRKIKVVYAILWRGGLTLSSTSSFTDKAAEKFLYALANDCPTLIYHIILAEKQLRRIRGEIKNDKPTILQKIYTIFRDWLKKTKLYCL